MTKQDILNYFHDLNFVYNDSSRLDTLSSMLDELVEEQQKDVHLGQVPADEVDQMCDKCSLRIAANERRGEEWLL